MATLIEDQIHNVFKAREEKRCRDLELREEERCRDLELREEERCRALEAKRSASGRRKPIKRKPIKRKVIKRNEVEKPWSRFGTFAHALLQDPELLQYVTEFAYDLADPKFQDYCRERGVLHVAGEPDSQRWEYAKDWRKGKRAFLANPHFRRAQPHDGKTYRYTAQELETHWGILCLARATLQDCWELYRPGKAPAPKPSSKRGARSVPPAPAKAKRKRPVQRSLFEEVPANARVRRGGRRNR